MRFGVLVLCAISSIFYGIILAFKYITEKLTMLCGKTVLVLFWLYFNFIYREEKNGKKGCKGR